MLFDLPADDFHRAVHQPVLLREGLVYNSQPYGQPPLGELSGVRTSGPVTVDFTPDDLRCNGGALRFGRFAGFQFAAQRLAVGNHDRPRKRTLVVVDDDLVDIRRFVHNRLFHPLGAVFLAVRCDQQAFEASQYIQEIVLRDIAHVARVQPSVAHGVGRSFGIFPISGHDVLAADHDFALLSAGNFIPLLVENLQIERNEYLAR